MLETFYATAAQLCFALLGLWWVVVQFKYEGFVRDAVRRRTAYNISLYFVLPGAMSLFSLLATELTVLWRIAFTVAAALGALESIVLLTQGGAAALPGGFARAGRWIAVLLYLLIAVLAIVPDLARGAGFEPQLVEGILLSLLVFLGVQFAWTFFVEDTTA